MIDRGTNNTADNVDSILEEIMGIKLHGGRDADALTDTTGDAAPGVPDENPGACDENNDEKNIVIGYGHVDRLVRERNNDVENGGEKGSACNDNFDDGRGNDRMSVGYDQDEMRGRGARDIIYCFNRGDELIFEGIDLNGGDTLDIKTEGRDVVIEVIGQDGGASRVTLKNAARRMDEVERENIRNDYMVTDSGTGTVTVAIEQIS